MEIHVAKYTVPPMDPWWPSLQRSFDRDDAAGNETPSAFGESLSFVYERIHIYVYNIYIPSGKLT